MRQLITVWVGLGLILGTALLTEAGSPLQGTDDVFVYLSLIRNSEGESTATPTATSTAIFTTTPVATTTMTTTPTPTSAVSVTPTAPPIPPSPTATSAPEATPTPITGTCQVGNGRFEEGPPGEAPPWVQEGTNAGTLVSADLPIGSPPSGRRAVYFGGRALSEDRLYQAVAIPAQATATTLSASYYIQKINWPFPAATTLNVELRDTNEQLLQSIDTIDLSDRVNAWFTETYEIDLSDFVGQTILIYFDFQTDQANAIFLDDVSFNACVR